MQTLYLIHAGKVSEADEFNANLATNSETVYALAESAEEALALAEECDLGRRQPDNALWHGETIVALQA